MLKSPAIADLSAYLSRENIETSIFSKLLHGSRVVLNETDVDADDFCNFLHAIDALIKADCLNQIPGAGLINAFHGSFTQSGTDAQLKLLNYIYENTWRKKVITNPDAELENKKVKDSKGLFWNILEFNTIGKLSFSGNRNIYIDSDFQPHALMVKVENCEDGLNSDNKLLAQKIAECLKQVLDPKKFRKEYKFDFNLDKFKSKINGLASKGKFLKQDLKTTLTDFLTDDGDSKILKRYINLGNNLSIILKNTSAKNLLDGFLYKFNAKYCPTTKSIQTVSNDKHSSHHLPQQYLNDDGTINSRELTLAAYDHFQNLAQENPEKILEEIFKANFRTDITLGKIYNDELLASIRETLSKSDDLDDIDANISFTVAIDIGDNIVLFSVGDLAALKLDRDEEVLKTDLTNLQNSVKNNQSHERPYLHIDKVGFNVKNTLSQYYRAALVSKNNSNGVMLMNDTILKSNDLYDEALHSYTINQVNENSNKNLVANAVGLADADLDQALTLITRSSRKDRLKNRPAVNTDGLGLGSGDPKPQPAQAL